MRISISFMSWAYLLLFTSFILFGIRYSQSQQSAFDGSTTEIEETSMADSNLYQEMVADYYGDGEATEEEDTTTNDLIFSPDRLEYDDSPISIPKVAEITIQNGLNTDVSVFSITSNNTQFHPIMFHPQTLAPKQLITVRLLFLPHSLETTNAKLHISTSSGEYSYYVRGRSVENPYHLHPYVGNKIIGGVESFEQSIVIYNPHPVDLHIREVFTTEEFLTLRGAPLQNAVKMAANGSMVKPNSEALTSTNGSEMLWVVQPGREKEIITISVSTKMTPGLYRGYVHIKTSHDNMVLPVEMEIVERKVFLPGSVDFGVLTSVVDKKTLSLWLLNSFDEDVLVTDIFPAKPDPQLGIALEPFPVVKRGVGRKSLVGTLSYKARTPGTVTNKIIVQTNMTNSIMAMIEVSYRVTVVDGGLSLPEGSIYFWVGLHNITLADGSPFLRDGPPRKQELTESDLSVVDDDGIVAGYHAPPPEVFEPDFGPEVQCEDGYMCFETEAHPLLGWYRGLPEEIICIEMEEFEEDSPMTEYVKGWIADEDPTSSTELPPAPDQIASVPLQAGVEMHPITLSNTFNVPVRLQGASITGCMNVLLPVPHREEASVEAFQVWQPMSFMFKKDFILKIYEQQPSVIPRTCWLDLYTNISQHKFPIHLISGAFRLEFMDGVLVNDSYTGWENSVEINGLSVPQNLPGGTTNSDIYDIHMGRVSMDLPRLLRVAFSNANPVRLPLHLIDSSMNVCVCFEAAWPIGANDELRAKRLFESANGLSFKEALDSPSRCSCKIGLDRWEEELPRATERSLLTMAPAGYHSMLSVIFPDLRETQCNSTSEQDGNKCKISVSFGSTHQEIHLRLHFDVVQGTVKTLFSRSDASAGGRFIMGADRLMGLKTFSSFEQPLSDVSFSLLSDFFALNATTHFPKSEERKRETWTYLLKANDGCMRFVPQEANSPKALRSKVKASNVCVRGVCGNATEMPFDYVTIFSCAFNWLYIAQDLPYLVADPPDEVTSERNVTVQENLRMLATFLRTTASIVKDGDKPALAHQLITTLKDKWAELFSRGLTVPPVEVVLQSTETVYRRSINNLTVQFPLVLAPDDYTVRLPVTPAGQMTWFYIKVRNPYAVPLSFRLLETTVQHALPIIKNQKRINVSRLMADDPPFDFIPSTYKYTSRVKTCNQTSSGDTLGTDSACKPSITIPGSSNPEFHVVDGCTLYSSLQIPWCQHYDPVIKESRGPEKWNRTEVVASAVYPFVVPAEVNGWWRVAPFESTSIGPILFVPRPGKPQTARAVFYLYNEFTGFDKVDVIAQSGVSQLVGRSVTSRNVLPVDISHKKFLSKKTLKDRFSQSFAALTFDQKENVWNSNTVFTSNLSDPFLLHVENKGPVFAVVEDVLVSGQSCFSRKRSILGMLSNWFWKIFGIDTRQSPEQEKLCGLLPMKIPPGKVWSVPLTGPRSCLNFDKHQEKVTFSVRNDVSGLKQATDEAVSLDSELYFQLNFKYNRDLWEFCSHTSLNRFLRYLRYGIIGLNLLCMFVLCTWSITIIFRYWCKFERVQKRRAEKYPETSNHNRPIGRLRERFPLSNLVTLSESLTDEALVNQQSPPEDTHDSRVASASQLDSAMEFLAGMEHHLYGPNIIPLPTPLSPTSAIAVHSSNPTSFPPVKSGKGKQKSNTANSQGVRAGMNDFLKQSGLSVDSVAEKLLDVSVPVSHGPMTAGVSAHPVYKSHQFHLAAVDRVLQLRDQPTKQFLQEKPVPTTDPDFIPPTTVRENVTTVKEEEATMSSSAQIEVEEKILEAPVLVENVSNEKGKAEVIDAVDMKEVVEHIKPTVEPKPVVVMKDDRQIVGKSPETASAELPRATDPCAQVKETTDDYNNDHSSPNSPTKEVETLEVEHQIKTEKGEKKDLTDEVYQLKTVSSDSTDAVTKKDTSSSQDAGVGNIDGVFTAPTKRRRGHRSRKKSQQEKAAAATSTEPEIQITTTASIDELEQDLSAKNISAETEEIIKANTMPSPPERRRNRSVSEESVLVKHQQRTPPRESPQENSQTRAVTPNSVNFLSNSFDHSELLHLSGGDRKLVESLDPFAENIPAVDSLLDRWNAVGGESVGTTGSVGSSSWNGNEVMGSIPPLAPMLPADADEVVPDLDKDLAQLTAGLLSDELDLDSSPLFSRDSLFGFDSDTFAGFNLALDGFEGLGLSKTSSARSRLESSILAPAEPTVSRHPKQSPPQQSLSFERESHLAYDYAGSLPEHFPPGARASNGSYNQSNTDRQPTTSGALPIEPQNMLFGRSTSGPYIPPHQQRSMMSQRSLSQASVYGEHNSTRGFNRARDSRESFTSRQQFMVNNSNPFHYLSQTQRQSAYTPERKGAVDDIRWARATSRDSADRDGFFQQQPAMPPPPPGLGRAPAASRSYRTPYHQQQYESATAAASNVSSASLHSSLPTAPGVPDPVSGSYNPREAGYPRGTVSEETQHWLGMNSPHMPDSVRDSGGLNNGLSNAQQRRQQLERLGLAQFYEGSLSEEERLRRARRMN